MYIVSLHKCHYSVEMNEMYFIRLKSISNKHFFAQDVTQLGIVFEWVRLQTDDTQAYIRMDCKRGNPVSALGVGGNSLWNKLIVAHTLKWPSGLVCLATSIKKNYTNILKSCSCCCCCLIVLFFCLLVFLLFFFFFDGRLYSLCFFLQFQNGYSVHCDGLFAEITFPRQAPRIVPSSNCYLAKFYWIFWITVSDLFCQQ